MYIPRAFKMQAERLKKENDKLAAEVTTIEKNMVEKGKCRLINLF